MDIVAVAASIAGILGLVGQSINGIIQLKGFFSDVASASRTIERFLRDINSLLHVLHDVDRLFSQLSASEFSGTARANSASLLVELEDCHNDVFEWLKLARDLRPASNRGRKSWFKRFWIGVNQASLKNIRMELERHRQAIQLNLAVIGRSLTVEASFKMSKIDKQVSQVQAISVSLDVALTNQRSALDRIERYSMTSLESSNDSLRSLGSIASSLSKLETAVPVTESCSSSLNALLRPTRSQRSFDRITRKSIDDVSSLGSVRRLAPESSGGLGRQAFLGGADAQASLGKLERIQPDQSDSRDSNLPHTETPSCQLCGQPWSSSTLNDSGERCASGLLDPIRSNRSMLSTSLYPVAELDTCDRCGEEFSDEVSCNEGTCLSPHSMMGKLTRGSMENHDCDHSSSGAIWMNAGQKPKEEQPKELSHSMSSDELDNQYSVLFKAIEGAYPSAVGQYVLWRGLITLTQCQMRILSPSRGGDLMCEHNVDAALTKKSTEVQQQQALETGQRYNEKMLGKLRSQCIQDGHSLYEIDSVLDLSVSTNSFGGSREHKHMLAIRKKTLDSNLLQAWVSTRDRINSWLLHSLRSDDKLAQVHRSMLADPEINEKEWARLTLKWWTLDEAATGIPWTPSQSVAATASKNSQSTESLDFWTCDESVASEDGPLMNEKLAAVKDELQMLKRQHQKRLYHGISSRAGDTTTPSPLLRL